MLITTLAILWGGLTTVLVALLVYRGTLRMHQTQILLDQHLANEQEQVITRIKRLQLWVRISGAGSAILIVIIVGLEGYAAMAH
ncbi:MAG TPA: hypothetical protein VG759_05155 [Candidatus Angelobacter sp.]|jgi:hypothetical protein|nr:hypothetical protein [Candidatus Angelobacter sp.]